MRHFVQPSEPFRRQRYKQTNVMDVTKSSAFFTYLLESYGTVENTNSVFK